MKNDFVSKLYWENLGKIPWEKSFFGKNPSTVTALVQLNLLRVKMLTALKMG